MVNSETLFYVFIPSTIIYILFVIIYISRESFKLRRKLMESGMLIASFPIIYLNNPTIPAMSPNGLPPPPPYSLSAHPQMQQQQQQQQQQFLQQSQFQQQQLQAVDHQQQPQQPIQQFLRVP